jgi:hypothetical protein
MFWLGQMSVGKAEGSVTLAWNLSQTAGVAGYCVYALEENCVTPTRTTVGNTNQATIANLKEGLHYSFSVTALNAAGVESDPSNGVLFTVPVPLSMVTPATTDNLYRIQFQGAPGRNYELQSSADLQSWATIWQSGPVVAYGPLEYQDPASQGKAQNFYRLIVR